MTARPIVDAAGNTPGSCTVSGNPGAPPVCCVCHNRHVTDLREFPLPICRVCAPVGVLPETERVFFAAVVDAGRVTALPRPARHIDVMRYCWERAGGPQRIDGDDQGFVTSRGRYVGREEAHKIAKAAGQLIPRAGGYRAGEVNDSDGADLFSEDLW